MFTETYSETLMFNIIHHRRPMKKSGKRLTGDEMNQDDKALPQDHALAKRLIEHSFGEILLCGTHVRRTSEEFFSKVESGQPKILNGRLKAIWYIPQSIFVQTRLSANSKPRKRLSTKCRKE